MLRNARSVRWMGRGLLVLTLATTVFAWLGTAHRLEADEEARFGVFSRNRVEFFREHAAHLAQVARSFQGLFLASDGVSRREFQTHYDSLRVQEALPEVVSVQFARWVPEGGREALEAEVRADRSIDARGYGAFTIHPSGERGGYLPIIYTEPFAGSERQFGRDVIADTHRRSVSAAVRDSGEISLSAPMRMNGDGFLMELRAPVYRSQGEPRSVEERRSLYLGEVIVVLRGDRLMSSVLPEATVQPYRARVTDSGSSDEPSHVPDRLLYDTRPDVDADMVLNQAPNSAHQQVHVVELGRRQLRFVFQRTQNPMLWAPEALLVLLSGGLLSAMLALTMRGLLRHARLSDEMVKVLDRRVESDDARLRGLIDQSEDGIITFDGEGTLKSANPSALAMFSLPASRICGRPVIELVEPAERARLQAYLGALAGSPASAAPRIEVRALRGDGATFTLSVSCRALAPGEGFGERIAVLRDLSSSQRTAAALKKLAQHDALTGMLNREAFQQRLAEALDGLQRRLSQGPSAPMALLFIDLDRFKKINETLGHLVGDRVLLEMAGRLCSVVGEGATVARMGGDEFAVMLPEVRGVDDAESLAQAILQSLAEPLEVDGNLLRVSASIGIACTEDADNAEDSINDVTLMSRADSAMYLAKNGGRNQSHVHRREDHQASPRQLQLEVDLHSSIPRGELELYFQPQFDCKTRRVVGAEALLRWRHRLLGMVSPAEFIPLAEESGLIVAMGRWVMDEACRQARLWQAVAERPITVAVNLSTRQMLDDDIVGVVCQALATHHLSPALLELEITEGAAVSDTEKAQGLLDRFSGLGVKVSIDDFGVGYSSLAYLRDLPVDRFKIDRSFLTNVPGDPGSSRLVSAMVSMARSLEVGLVAEGVETAEQLDFLVDQGCDIVQGFLLGRPMPASSFLQFLERACQTERAPVEGRVNTAVIC